MRRTSWHFRIAALGLLLTRVSTAFASRPEFQARWSADSVRAGQEIRLTLTATWEGDASRCLLGEVLLGLPPGVQRLAIQPASGAVTFRDGAPTASFSWECSLQPEKEGEYTLDRVEVRFRDPESPSEEWQSWKPSPPLRFQATRALPAARTLALPAAIVAGILLLGGVLYATLSWRERKLARMESIEDLETPALEKLAELRSLRVRGDIKAYFTRLDALLRDYGMRKYGLEQPTDQALVEAVGRTLDAPLARRLESVLQLAENVRFGGAPPLPTDVQRAHAVALEILERQRAHGRADSLKESIAFRKE
ncbi:MAG: hypothetical protein HYU36_10185 [Planctomycetes bacterium]|nr:hypothetical protein [Planctomycetota bacterium]